MLLDKMLYDGDLAEIWDVFTPVLNSYSTITISWIPGHMNIHRNEVAHVRAKGTVGKPVNMVRYNGLCFGIEDLMAAQKHRKNQ